MIKAFKQIPEPLQRQILSRLGWGAGVFLLTIALFIYTMEIFSVVFCAAVVIFFVISAFMLFRCAVVGDYVVINGECIGVTLTPLKRQTKTITIRTEDNSTLKITIKHRLKKIKAGSQIMLYVASNVPIYENGGVHLINTYLAFDMKGGD